MSPFPPQVDILYDVEGGNQTPVCAGTIISAYLILTVASCLAGKNESFLKVRAHGENQDDPETWLVERVLSYPALQSEPSSFDVALIRLKSGLDLSLYDFMSYKDQSTSLSTLSCKASVCEGEVIRMSVLAQSECLERRGDKNAVCLRLRPEENVDCEKPLAGSGLFCDEHEDGDIHPTLYGVFAVGSWDKGKSRQVVFTKVAGYAPWIRLAIEQDESTSYSNDSGLAATSSGGTEVNQMTDPVPYQLSIRSKDVHSCGAVILDKKTALSAAHCFPLFKTPNWNINNYKVVAGEQNLSRVDGTEQTFEMERLSVHPKYLKYRDILKGNDIAVIRIKGEFRFNERVSNAWISSRSTPDFTGLTGRVTGWGKTETNGQSSNVLQWIELELLDRKTCNNSWSAFLKDSMICGYRNSSSVCGGDSGGPLVLKNHVDEQDGKKDLLVGIISFAHRICELKNQLNGFTNVAHFYDFIARERSNSLCPSSQFQCFNGECIHEELKCDKKYDCEDGSDEKVCKFHSPVTRSCGGLIKLAYSQTIEWTAPVSHPHPNSSCLWIIANPHGDRPATTQIKITNKQPYKFDAASSQLYVLQDLTASQLSTTQLNKIGQAYNFTEPFLMLYFRSNSTQKNSGIHLTITDTSESIIPSGINEQQSVLSQDDLQPNPNKNPNPNPSSRDTFTAIPQSFSHVYAGSHCRRKMKSRHIFRNAPLQNSSSNSQQQNSPYVVSIQLDGDHICSGVILDKKTVLSTASCFDWNELDGIQIVAGERNLNSTSSTPQILEIEKLVKHGKWKYPKISSGNDIALVHVNGQFNFNDRVNNIWISSPDILKLEGASGSLSAWIAPNSSVADFLPDLKTMNVDILQNSECKKTYSFLKESMICGSRNRTNVCGMTGAPLVLKNQSFGNSSRDVLIGISAFGDVGCENASKPIGFIRTDYFYDWIEKNRANSICNSTSEFQCYNGGCIPKESKCNYVFDCSDGSDESVCTSGSSTTVRQLDSCTRRPGNGRAAAGQIIARDQENLFALLKPEDGGRIQVHLDSLHMAAAQDSLKIFSYRQNSQEMARLDRLDGVGNRSNEIFYGDENEPVLVYFQATPRNENQKVDLSYMEKRRVPPSTTCGGNLELKDELEIVYRISQESQNVIESGETICEWKIQSSNGSSVEATLFHNPSADFHPATSSLSAAGNYKLSPFTEIQEKYETYQLDVSSMKLTFRSKSSDSNTGFHLHLKNPDSGE